MVERLSLIYKRLYPKEINMKSQEGFTLIETFGAITILIIAVLGPLTLLTNNISDGSLLKDQMTASYLAQEGIELVINRRDANYEAGVQEQDDSPNNQNAWLTGLEDCIGNNASCNIDLPMADISQPPPAAEACGGSSDPCTVFIEDRDGGLYRIGGTNNANATIFTRTIKIEPFNSIDSNVSVDPTREYFYASEGAKVTVTVSWMFKTFSKRYVLSTIIYNPEATQRIIDSGLQF